MYIIIYINIITKKTGSNKPAFTAMHRVVNEVRTRIQDYDGHIYIPNLKDKINNLL